MITTRIIDEQHKQDINIKNEPFRIWGRMIPSYIDEKWDYRIEKFHEEKIEEDCFPDEDYDYDAMKKEYFFVGAYDGEDCVGVALLRRHYFKYLYLDDLKVSKAYRGQKIGHLLIDHCKKVAKENGYRGVYTIG